MKRFNALQQRPNKKIDSSTLIERSGLFDPQFYTDSYPDLASTRLSPLEHYMLLGAREGRDPNPLFDASFYLAKNPCVASSGLIALEHYIRYGADAGLDPHPLFDTAYYKKQSPEISQTGENPLLHFVCHGAECGLDPHPLFDTSFYIERYPDVRLSGLNPLVHYNMVGAAEGRDPHPRFSTSFYVQQYPDVLESGMNPLKHYVQHGTFEERLPRNLFLDGVADSIRAFYPPLREIEPSLPTLEALSKLRLRKSAKNSLAGAVYFKLANMLDIPFTHLVLIGNVSDMHSSACELIQSLATEHGASSVLVLAADKSPAGPAAAHCGPPTCTELLVAADSFSAFEKYLPSDVQCFTLDRLAKELTVQDRMTIVLRLILQVEPKMVFDFKSQICATISREYRSQLSDVTRFVDCTSERTGDLKKFSGEQKESKREQKEFACEMRKAGTDPAAVGVGDASHDSCSVDISLIVNCHSEGDLLIPTIRAASLAAENARASGLKVEWLFVLDRANKSTRQCLKQNCPTNAQLIETDLGDPGLARNAGIKQTRGEFVSFIDGDDLYSPNWLEAAFNYARQSNDKPMILHPFGTICFGEIELINLFYSSDDPEFSRNALIIDTSWQSNSFAKRSIYLSHPYRATDLQKGFGYEDWLWNCDTIAAGVEHRLVPDTFFCYRVKPSLNSRNGNAHSCILGKGRFFDLKFQKH